MVKRILFLFFLCALIFTFLNKAVVVVYAANKQIEHGTTVNATVAGFYLSITGFQSPNASIIITTQNGLFIASTTADSKGYFTISNTLISDALSGFCFQAVDFKRLGESYACINISSPIIKDLVYKDIFLPPTIGLSKKQINAGQNAIIYGYTMPNGTVFLTIENKIITLTADSNGYYQYIYENVKPGVYRLSATGELNGVKSLTPMRGATLEALSLPSQVTTTAKNIAHEAKKKFPIDLTLLLLIGLISLTAIGVLLYKLRVKAWVIFIDFLRRRKKMHHDWFLDFWQ